jgi:hypothetical protein
MSEEMIRLGVIKSAMMQRSDTKETGVYELPVETGKAFLLGQPDKKGYILRVISMHLESCVRSTGIPPGEGHWKMFLEREIAYAINSPMELSL